MSTLKVAVAEVLGFIVLLPACLVHAWTDGGPSIKPLSSTTDPPIPGRRTLVDQWSWSWLRPWYNNVEDGVSAQQAYVWNAGGTEYVPYASLYPSWVPQWAIAYGWSAWRNGANNLKRPLR